jgi:hypothetical protein
VEEEQEAGSRGLTNILPASSSGAQMGHGGKSNESGQHEATDKSLMIQFNV